MEFNGKVSGNSININNKNVTFLKETAKFSLDDGVVLHANAGTEIKINGETYVFAHNVKIEKE